MTGSPICAGCTAIANEFAPTGGDSCCQWICISAHRLMNAIQHAASGQTRINCRSEFIREKWFSRPTRAGCTAIANEFAPTGGIRVVSGYAYSVHSRGERNSPRSLRPNADQLWERIHSRKIYQTTEICWSQRPKSRMNSRPQVLGLWRLSARHGVGLDAVAQAIAIDR